MRNNSFIKKHQTVILLFLSILVGLLVMRYILSDVGRVPKSDYKVLKNMSVEVQHEDGSVGRRSIRRLTSFFITVW